MPQSPDSHEINLCKLEQRLGSLLAERNQLLQKKSDAQDASSKQWYSARLKHVDDLIHNTRNALFIERNAML